MFDRIRSMLSGSTARKRDKALCILPWVHVHARVDGTVLPCCVADERGKWGSMHTTRIEKLFNFGLIRKLRRDMLAGVRSPVCRRCYDLEDAGGQSLRQIFNRELDRHAAVVNETAPDGAVDPKRIIYIDVRYSNLCNLRCRSCGSAASTSWYQDDPQSAPADFRILRAGASQEELWGQVEPFLATVERMHFAGGEPMMMDETYQMLEKLLELGRTKVELTYNTNVTTWTHRRWDVLEFWKQFENVTVLASLDGAGERGEYIRKGLNWRESVENCLRLRRECPHVHFQVSCTVGLMNALHLLDFCDACVSEGFVDLDRIHLNFIQDPVTMSMTSLPGVLKEQVRVLYQRRITQLGSESEFAERLREALHYMDSRDTTESLPKLRRETLALDEKRSESFTETFPELAAILAPE